MAKDLRSFLDEIRSRSGDLVEVDKSLRPQDCEATALLRHLDYDRRYPTVVFNKPTDMYGEESAFPLISNVFATRQRCAIALGVNPATPYRKVALEYAKRARRTIEPETIDESAAPIYENVWQGDQVDVGKLPIVKHFKMDFGPVLTMAHALRSHDGFNDLSFAKTFYTWDPRRMVVSIHTPHLSRILKEYTDAGEPTPIVNVLGHHPAFYLGTLARNPYGVDDYASIGSFLDEPVRLVPSKTWGDRVMIPADAEMVIEAEIPPGERDLCDPFGEVAGLYQAQCLRPVMNVTAIAFRDGAMMQDIFSGFRDSYVGFHCVIKEAALEEELRPSFPNLKEIAMPTSAYGIQCAYISVSDADPDVVEKIGRKAIEAVGLHAAVVVDDNIDVYDEDQVMWAVHTYLDPGVGVKVLRSEKSEMAGFANYVPKSGFGTTNWGDYKVVIDATRPTHFAFGWHNEIPQEALDRIRLEDYLPDLGGRA